MGLNHRSEAAHTAGEITRLPQPLRSFLWILASLCGLCLLVELICRFLLHKGYPYDWPLMFPNVSFMDFAFDFDHFGTLHTEAFFVRGPTLPMYPAPVVLIYWFFYAFGSASTPVFVTFIVVASLCSAVCLCLVLVRKGVKSHVAIAFIGLSYLLSYPFWFEVKQANTEIVVWCLLTAGIYCFWKGHDWQAALLFGLVGALKFYPIIYLGLLLSRRKFGLCILGIAVAATAMVASLWLLGPTIHVAWLGTKAGLEQFHNDYMLVIRPNEIGFDHSLFGLLKQVFTHTRYLHIPQIASTHGRTVLLSTYLITVSLLGSLLYIYRIRKMPATNQILCFAVASVLLPPVSYDYTLIHLYAPWALLTFIAFQAAKRSAKIDGLHATFACLAVCVAPLSEFILRADRVGGQLRSVALLVMFVLALRYPFEQDPSALTVMDAKV